MQLVLQHGWGLSGNSWEGWPEDAIRLDRGYFGNPETEIPPADERMVVAHSLGAHLLSKELIASADHLVLIAPFERIVDRRMAKRMKGAPLEAFYSVCWHPYPSPPVPQHPNWELLNADLELMCRSRLNCDLFRGATLITGTDDQVIPPVLVEHLSEKVQNSRLWTIQGAGHAVPFTHSKIILARCEKLRSACGVASRHGG